MMEEEFLKLIVVFDFQIKIAKLKDIDSERAEPSC